jgi:hypothetical protein
VPARQTHVCHERGSRRILGWCGSHWPPYDCIETAKLQADTVRALIRRPIDDVAQIVNKNADNLMLFHVKIAVLSNFAGLCPTPTRLLRQHNPLKLLSNIFQRRANSDIKAVKKLRF